MTVESQKKVASREYNKAKTYHSKFLEIRRSPKSLNVHQQQRFRDRLPFGTIAS